MFVVQPLASPRFATYRKYTTVQYYSTVLQYTTVLNNVQHNTTPFTEQYSVQIVLEVIQLVLCPESQEEGTATKW